MESFPITWLEIDEHLERSGATLWVAAVPDKALEKARRMYRYQQWTSRNKIHVSVATAVAAFEQTRQSSG